MYKVKELKNGGWIDANGRDEFAACLHGSCAQELIEKLNRESNQRKKQKCGQGDDDDDVLFLEEVRSGERAPNPDQIIDLVDDDDDDDDEGNTATERTKETVGMSTQTALNENHGSSSSSSSSSSSIRHAVSPPHENMSIGHSSNNHNNHFSHRSMTPSCEAFVTRCFQHCNTDAMRSAMAVALERIIRKVASEGRMGSHSWYTEAVPQISGTYPYPTLISTLFLILIVIRTYPNPT